MKTRTTHQGPFSKLFGSIILVVVGIALSFLSGFMADRDANVKERCTAQVQASVTGFKHSESTDSSEESTAVTPVFEYEYYGQTYTSHAGSYSSNYKDKFSVGQTYTIFIDPNDPVEVYSADIAASDAATFKYMKIGGVALVIFGIAAFVISIIKLVAIGGAIGLAASSLLKKRTV